MSFVDCEDVRAALHRAFDTWAMNHKYVKFTDVTNECAKQGHLDESCPLAEVWVTYLNSSASTYGGLASTSDSRDAAQAVPFPTYSTSFQYSNSRSPIVQIGNNFIPRQVIEPTLAPVPSTEHGPGWDSLHSGCSLIPLKYVEKSWPSPMPALAPAQSSALAPVSACSDSAPSRGRWSRCMGAGSLSTQTPRCAGTSTPDSARAGTF